LARLEKLKLGNFAAAATRAAASEENGRSDLPAFPLWSGDIGLATEENDTSIVVVVVVQSVDFLWGGGDDVDDDDALSDSSTPLDS